MPILNEHENYIVSLQQYHLSEVDDAISRGQAVVRSLRDFETLDASLRDECVSISVPFPSSPDHQTLQHYLQLILQFPQAFRSNALADFLTVAATRIPVSPDDGNTEPATPIQCIEYLLPAIQSPTYRPIPRFGSSKSATDVIQPGWWLVWYVKSDVSVDFEVAIVPTLEDGVAHQKQQQQQQVIHKETTCELQQQQQTRNCSFGSYRILSDPSSAVLTVTGRSILMMTGKPARFILEWDLVPHLAFVAACTAAKESMMGAERRRRAPLLSRLLDYSNAHNPVHLCLRVAAMEGMQGTGEAREPADDREATSALSDQVATMTQEIQGWKRCCTDLKTELAKAQALIQSMNQQLETTGSERRVWNVVRSELHLEMSRLSQEVEAERKEKVKAMSDLQEARQELREVSGQITLSSLQDGNHALYTNGSKNQLAELSQTMRQLEADLLAERSENETLRKSIDKIEKLADVRVSMAMDELHQARMGQRALQQQIRQLEDEKRRIRTLDAVPRPHVQPTTRLQELTLDPEIANFQHPDPRVNQQLSTLLDRHRKLSTLVAQNPGNTKNIEILAMLEKAVRDIVAKSNTPTTQHE